MISKELAEELNRQIQEEFQSASYYLGMASWFEHETWDGFAHFMKVQSEEEVEHAMKFYDFLNRVDVQAVIPGLEEPEIEYDSIVEVFETALKQEQHITGRIHRLLELARENDDPEALSLLQWFVDEQIEEENLMGDLLDKVRRIDGDPTGLLYLDDELSERDSGDHD